MKARIITLITVLLALVACSGTAPTTPAASGGAAAPSSAPVPVVVKVGYIPGAHDIAQLFVADEKGYFKEQGITIEATSFQTGISLSQALTGGSLDVGVMGAVIANFPARGQGVAFVLNNQQVDIRQIWASPKSGIAKIDDLRGKTIATTFGTAGDVILQAGLEKAKLTRNDVKLVNLDMPAAVNAFITGSVDAVSTWSPFDQQIETNLPGAKLVATAAQLDTPIPGGWVANNDYYKNHRDVLVKMTKAWQKANTDLIKDTAASLNLSCERIKTNMPKDRCVFLYGKTDAYSNEQWAKYYEDGTAVGWVARTQEIFERIGALQGATKKASEYVDTSIFKDALKA